MIRLALDKALEKHGMTRYERGKRTGIQHPVIDHYDKNKVKRHDSYVLDRICDALGCSVSEILEYKK